jgi:phosphoglycolate phosphatase
VYDGVFEALDTLRTAPDGFSRTMAVLSNKPVGPSQAICDALGLTPYFFRVYGGNSFTTKKPDPEGLTTLIREAGVSPEETVMVGDSDVDILTARRAKTWAIGCRYGLSSHTVESIPSDCLADSPLDWISALDIEKINQ